MVVRGLADHKIKWQKVLVDKMNHSFLHPYCSV